MRAKQDAQQSLRVDSGGGIRTHSRQQARPGSDRRLRCPTRCKRPSSQAGITAAVYSKLGGSLVNLSNQFLPGAGSGARLGEALRGLATVSTGATAGIIGGLVAYQRLQAGQEAAAAAATGLRNTLGQKVDVSDYDAARAAHTRIVEGVAEIDHSIRTSVAPWDEDYRDQLQEYRNGLVPVTNEFSTIINQADALPSQYGITSQEAARLIARNEETERSLREEGDAAAYTEEELIGLTEATIGLFGSQLSVEEATIKARQGISDLGQIYAFGAVTGDELRVKEIEVEREPRGW